MLFLTVGQHQEVVRRLVNLGRDRNSRIASHSEGFEYTSLMICFLLHNLSSAEVLLRLSTSFGKEWFPVTVGYTVVRTMFEADVTAHYITQNPRELARRYVDYGAVLNKHRLDACIAHRKSSNPQWRDAMDLVWQNHWLPRHTAVNEKFDAVVNQFVRTNRKGKKTISTNWSGKTLRQMAEEVNHAEAYDIFYAELSSFTHVDVHLADRFLKVQTGSPEWSQRADEFDVGNVFRYAATFLTCYLELFGEQFRTWSNVEVEECWTACP